MMELIDRLDMQREALRLYLAGSPVALFAFLATLAAVIFWVSARPGLQRFFRFFPALIWMYFLPMLCSSVGLIPHESPLYGFMVSPILPVIIVLLLLPSDPATIARVGPKGIAMMLIGTLGIVAGAAGSIALFLYFLPAGTLPPDLWKGVAALSGSWIGGSPNMAAIAASVSLEPTLFGKMVVVDTVCAYTWLGVLIALVGWQARLDRFNRADGCLVEQLASRLALQQAERSRPIHTPDVLAILGIGFAVSQLCLFVGESLGSTVSRAEQAGGVLATLRLSQVLSGFGWGILLTTAAGIALSFTSLRKLDDAGASSLGNAGLYLLLTTFGAQADLRLIGREDAWLFAIGAVWLLIHIAILFVGARLLRAPLFLVATGSMANVGGTASAPVVAAAFHPSLAPVGLLLAILGGIIGTPIGLLVVGKLCAALAETG
ncbi:MAG: hypothetical protein AMXMBFR13_01930 [Phycisphaerae bacterium]